MRSGVLTGNDTGSAAHVATAHCPTERTLDPAVCSQTDPTMPQPAALWPSPRNVLELVRCHKTETFRLPFSYIGPATRSVAIAKKADRTAYDVQYSCRTEPPIYNCRIIMSCLVDAVAASLRRRWGDAHWATCLMTQLSTIEPYQI